MKRFGAAPARGFTLVEIMVSLGIASVIFSIGYYAITTTMSSSNRTTQRVRDSENMRLFFQLLERDLSTASPGPGNLQKTAFPATDFASAHALVVTDTGNSEAGVQFTVDSSVLQLYCHTEEPNLQAPTGLVPPFPDPLHPPAPDYIFVRYYMNRTNHTLCRHAVPFYVGRTNPATAQFPENDDPRPATAVANNDEALFDNVRQIRVDFQFFDPTTKSYKRTWDVPNAPTSRWDSMIVTVIFSDEFQQKAIDAFNPDKGSDTYKSAADRTYRSFSKVFALPVSFKN